MRNNRYFQQLLVIFLLLHFHLYVFFNLYTLLTINQKFAEDYSAIDLLSAQKIVLGDIKPTEDTKEKYDIDMDGYITNTDVQIIQHMIVGFYDSYVVKNNSCVTIKDIFELKGELNE